MDDFILVLLSAFRTIAEVFFQFCFTVLTNPLQSIVILFNNSAIQCNIDVSQIKSVALSPKSITICLLFFLICYAGSAQKIIVDTTSTNKYLITKPTGSVEVEETEEELSFSDRAMSIGMGILNRLKARLNLEEASETLKEKGQKYLGKKEEDKDTAKEKGDG